MNDNAKPDEEIADLITAFDDSWQELSPLPIGGISGVCPTSECFVDRVACAQPRSASIQRFLQLNKVLVPYPRILLAGLIGVDIERSWMAWNRWLSNHWSDTAAEWIVHSFDLLPRLGCYIDLLGPIDPACAHWCELAEIECAARAEWGDSIGTEHYQVQFGLKIRCRSAAMPRQVRIHHPLRVALSRESLPFELRGKMLIGRRRGGDPTGEAYFPTDHGYRLVIAERTENRISRDQLWVTAMNPHIAAVGILAKMSPNASTPHLKRNRVHLLEFPFHIEIEDHRLSFG